MRGRRSAPLPRSRIEGIHRRAETGEGEGEAFSPPFSNRGNTVFANTGLRRAETGEEQVPPFPVLKLKGYLRIPSLVGQARYMRYFSFR